MKGVGYTGNHRKKEKRWYCRRPFLSLQKISPAILVSAAVLAAILLGTSYGLAFSNENENVVIDLVSRRTDAMSGYFASKLSYWESGSILKEAESGELLAQDLKKMRDFFRTDIEQVKEYEILRVDFTLEDDEILCAVVDIHWLTEGIEGEERLVTSHSVICEKQSGDSDYKLVHFF